MSKWKTTREGNVTYVRRDPMGAEMEVLEALKASFESLSGRRMVYWMLDEEGELREADSPEEWSAWFSDPNTDRRVARDNIGGVIVSTVFLGIDHRGLRDEDSDPVLWETLIMGAKQGTELDGYEERYTSKQAALEGHWKAVRHARRSIIGAVASD